MTGDAPEKEDPAQLKDVGGPEPGPEPPACVTLPAVGKIGPAIVAIMHDVGGIGKDAENKEQHYEFRSADAVMTAVHPLLVKHRVFCYPYKILTDELGPGPKGNGVRVRQRIIYRFEHADDGSFRDVEVTGEGVDYGDKASNKAMTVSLKYAICQLFVIPYSDPDSDPDFTSPENGPPDERRGRQNAGRQAQGKPPQQGQRQQPKPAPAPGKKELLEALGAKGVQGAEAVLDWIGKQLGRKVAATKEVQPAELPKLFTAVKAMPEKGTR